MSLNPAKRAKEAQAVAQDVLADVGCRTRSKVNAALHRHDADSGTMVTGAGFIEDADHSVSDSGPRQGPDDSVRVLRSSRTPDQTEVQFPDQDDEDNAGHQTLFQRRRTRTPVNSMTNRRTRRKKGPWRPMKQALTQ